jgi:poly(hydroxyalkanoate) granule-associated protein
MAKSRNTRTTRTTRTASTTRSRIAAKPPARKLWLAGIGAAEAVRKRGEEAIEAIVGRGEQLRSDANRLAKGLQKDFRKAKGDVEKQVRAYAKPIQQRTRRVARRIEGGIADGVGALLGRFGVPSRAEVLQLSERVDALSRSIKARARRAA